MNVERTLFKNVSGIGDLKVDEIYMEKGKNIPILFLCSNKENELFLCSCNEREGKLFWIVSESNEEMIQNIKKGKQDIIEAFKMNERSFLIQCDGLDEKCKTIKRDEISKILNPDFPTEMSRENLRSIS